MASRRGVENGLRAALILGLLSNACGGPISNSDIATANRARATESENGPDPFLDEKVDSNFTQTVTPRPIATESFVATPVPTKTKEVAKLANPFPHVFNQRCQVWERGAGNWQFGCVEDWAGEPLPGGASNPAKNYLGSSTCNAAATSFVINEMVPPEIIQKAIGNPGIDPRMLVYGVYENLPDGQGFLMNSGGAGFEKIVPALHVFGLEATMVKNLSWYSLPDFVRKLKNGQTLMISMIGTNAKGKKFQHYTVVNGVDDRGRVYFYDSFFYEDPKRAETDFDYREHVYFQNSPNIMDDPSSPIGKKVDIVGAAIVEKGDFTAVKKIIDVNLLLQKTVPGVDFQVEYVRNRGEYVVGDRGLDLGKLSFLDQPVSLGNNRYRIGVQYKGSSYNYYYYDPDGGNDLPDLDTLIWYKWGANLIPLFKQTDPEWGARSFGIPAADGASYAFGRKGCGEAVAASVLSMIVPGRERVFIDPFEIYETFFPNLKAGSGTFPTDYEHIYKSAGFSFTWIGRNKRSVMDAAFSGKLVVVQGGVDFKWGGAGGGRVDHFLLVLPLGQDGTIQIFDPVWGVGVTTLDDIDFNQSFGVMALSLSGN